MPSQVDPRAPRFGQAVTASGLLGAVVLQEPVLLYLVTVLLVVPVASRWRIDPYRFLWKNGVSRFLDPPEETESAIPHRFARVVGAVFTLTASAVFVGAIVSGIELLALAGYGIAVVVAVLAALGATTGFCLGCRMYEQVGLFRDLGVLSSPTEASQ